MKLKNLLLIPIIAIAISSTLAADINRQNDFMTVREDLSSHPQQNRARSEWESGSNLSMLFESRIRNSFNIDRIINKGDMDSSAYTGNKRYLFGDLKSAGKIYLSDSWYIYSAPGRLDRTDALWLAGIISVEGTIYAYDRKIYNAFKRNQNHTLYKPIKQVGDNIEKIGHMGITGKYFFGALVTGYILDIKPMTRISSQIIEAFFITGGVKNVATIVVGRTRPHEGNGPGYFRFNKDGTSFPSGHSINVIEIADILSHNIDYRPFRIGCYGLVTVVCLQRITSDSHWPSDVYFSAIFGWVVSHDTTETRRILDDLANTNKELKEIQIQLIQSEKMASLGMLVAGIAHEINTPIGAVNSMHDTLIRAMEKLKVNLKLNFDKQYEQNAELISIFKIVDNANRVIESGTNRVMNIVRRLRSFARLDEAEFKKSDIHEGLEDTLIMINHEIKHKATIIREYGKIPSIPCYSGPLNQVFLNLLINAIQAFKDKGEIKIKTYKDNDRVFIEIADNGIGITSDNLKRIFDPGFTTKGVGVGTGLGLSICYQIIQDHRGDIRAESEPGKGTKFIISFPSNLDKILGKRVQD